MMSMEEIDTMTPSEVMPHEKVVRRSHESLLGFLIMLVIVIFLVVLASYGGWLLYQGVKEYRGDTNRVSIERIPLGMSAEEKKDEPKKSEENKSEESVSVKSDAPAVSKKIAVKVMNGGAAKGSASVVAGVLMGSGYGTVSTGNATGDHTGLTVYFKAPATQADANAVKESLLKKYPGAVVKPSVAGTADTVASPVTVIVGK
jgi:cytoskeletal protein RodZ